MTVPTDLLPPITDVGANEKLANAGGLIVRDAVWLALPNVQEIVTVFVL